MLNKKTGAIELQKFRERVGWSVRDLCDEINKTLPEHLEISFSTISAWEQGRNPVSFWVMFYLSHKSSGELQSFAKLMCKEMAG